MSTGLKRNWKDGDEWRKVAYLYYHNSAEWRYLLELNKSYDIRYTPAPTVNVLVSGEVPTGSPQPSNVGQVGTLGQVGTNIDLRSDTANIVPTSTQNSIWPWANANEYNNRLAKYTAAGMILVDRTNGFAFDSPQAWRDTQR